MTSDKLPDPPQPLPAQIRLLVSLSARCATLHSSPRSTNVQWYKTSSELWLKSVIKLLSIDYERLPPSILPSNVIDFANDQRSEWSSEEIVRIAGILLEASLASEASISSSTKHKEESALKYTPLGRALSYKTLELLGLEAKSLVPEAEKNLSSTLFSALRAAAEKENEEKVEKAKAAQSQGWGGSLGRTLATGAGVVAGGVLLGVTGGLAAPAIAAVLAPLGIGSILSASAAPVVLGTLFGVGGGGLAGKRVRERWRGVEEFSFVEIGDGTSVTVEEMDDLKEAREKAKARAATAKKDEEKPMVDDDKVDDEEGEEDEKDTAKMVEEQRSTLEEKLLKLSLEAGTRQSISAPKPTTTSATASSTSSGKAPSLDNAKEEKALTEVKKPPSLTATIVVPGLLTVSKTEAITAWRAICSSNSIVPVIAPRAVPREREKKALNSAETETETDGRHEGDGEMSKIGFQDGRDVYLLRFESGAMLKTGRDVDFWVTGKLKGYVKKQIIKRTLLNAYFAAVSLPMSVYSMATMTLDNTWMHAQDRAKKAGRLLGEVIEKRVQGERPVVLIGSSLGAYTILEALLYLSSLPPPLGSGGRGGIPSYVESAYFISLPSSPSTEEWSKVRSVVSRRIVNAWSESDLVLAGVVRLHEVVSRAAVMSNGIKVAGLGPVNQPGIQDVDVSSVLKGHMELQTKMPEILRIIDIDA